jgi:hypothetical protein
MTSIKWDTRHGKTAKQLAKPLIRRLDNLHDPRAGCLEITNGQIPMQGKGILDPRVTFPHGGMASPCCESSFVQFIELPRWLEEKS